MKHSYFSRRLLSVFMAFALGLSVLLAKDFVVVIDAGHGGHDPGSLGSKAKEKNINLGVALKLGRLIENNMQGVKVVYTRKKDVYLTLQERANIANKVQGDLFISIHTNSLDKKSPNRRKVAGASTWTLGLHRSKENLEVAKRENSVIYLENDFSTRYEGFDPNSTESYIIFEFMQYKHMEQSINFASDIQREFVSTAGRVDRGVRQAGFWVLAKTSMPAVLVELDFICNPTQERFLNSESGQEKMAKSIYNAFVKYKSDYDRKQNAGKSHRLLPPLYRLIKRLKRVIRMWKSLNKPRNPGLLIIKYSSWLCLGNCRLIPKNLKGFLLSNIIKTEECINTPMENLPTETKYRNNIKK